MKGLCEKVPEEIGKTLLSLSKSLESKRERESSLSWNGPLLRKVCNLSRMPLISALRRQREVDLYEFKASLVYKVSSRAAKALYKEILS